MYLIDCVSAAGFNICPDEGMVIRCRLGFELARYLHMGFHAPQPPFAEIVCCRQAEILHPQKVRHAVFRDSVEQGPLPGCSIVIRVSLVFGPSVSKAFIQFLVKILEIGLSKRSFATTYCVLAVLYG